MYICNREKHNDMTTKEALLNKEELNGEFSFMTPVEWRNTERNYHLFYTKEQLNYLLLHGMVEYYKPCGASWEKPDTKYMQFTKKGKRLRRWYTTKFWDYVSIYVLKKYWWRKMLTKLLVKLGKKYAWQDYDE